jgi:hypothetical protein
VRITKAQVIDRFLKESQKLSAEDRKNLLRELIQEAVLCHMVEVGLFEDMAFHGGTALRLLHRLDRFSEDLDMSLVRVQKSYDLASRMKLLKKSLSDSGLNLEFHDKCKADNPIKKFWINDSDFFTEYGDYFGDVIPGQKLKIKFELDVEPADHQAFETLAIQSHFAGKIFAHDLPTCMGQKIHAILCRGFSNDGGVFVKGRDFYDLEWYLKRGIKPNCKNLSGCLNRTGPWANQGIEVDETWITHEIARSLESKNFNNILSDLQTFIDAAEFKRIKSVWSAEYFNRLLNGLISPRKNLFPLRIDGSIARNNSISLKCDSCGRCLRGKRRRKHKVCSKCDPKYDRKI